MIEKFFYGLLCDGGFKSAPELNWIPYHVITKDENRHLLPYKGLVFKSEPIGEKLRYRFLKTIYQLEPPQISSFITEMVKEYDESKTTAFLNNLSYTLNQITVSFIQMESEIRTSSDKFFFYLTFLIQYRVSYPKACLSIGAAKGLLERPDFVSSLFSEKFAQPNNDNMVLPDLTWTGLPVELSELIDALYSTRKIKGLSKDEMFSFFCNLLKVRTSLKTFNSSLTEIKDRKKSKTKFLDSLTAEYGKVLQNRIEKSDQ